MIVTPPGTLWPLPPDPVCRFTVDEYHKMIEIGILSEDDSVELLEGWITQKMSQNTPHQVTVDLVPDVLRPLLPANWRIRVQLPITTSDSEPEPDHAIVPGPATRYMVTAPVPADVGLLIEVSDTTLSRDRGQKKRLCARAKIGCYWIINLIDRQIEVYTDPTGPDPAPTYRQRQEYRVGDSVPLIIAGQNCGSIAVSALLLSP
jgi:hypothetical protein